MSSRITADDVHSGLHGSGDALLKSLGEMMMGRDICDGSAIGDYVPLESPIVPEKFAKKSRVGASGLAVQGIVGTHDGTDVGLRDGGAKSGKIGVLHIVERCTHVNVVPRGFLATVNSEMLRSGEGLALLKIPTLQTPHQPNSHPTHQQ